MKTLILITMLLAGPALAHDEPTAAETKAQLDRIEQTQRSEAIKAKNRAFMQRHREVARRHQQRGMCAANGSC